MSDPNQIVNVLNLARDNAAQDLRISNEILSTVDELIKKSALQTLSPQEVELLAQRLIRSALKLTENSKRMSYSVTRLMGDA